jgi:hypothetical protein
VAVCIVVVPSLGVLKSALGLAASTNTLPEVAAPVRPAPSVSVWIHW